MLQHGLCFNLRLYSNFFIRNFELAFCIEPICTFVNHLCFLWLKFNKTQSICNTGHIYLLIDWLKHYVSQPPSLLKSLNDLKEAILKTNYNCKSFNWTCSSCVDPQSHFSNRISFLPSFSHLPANQSRSWKINLLKKIIERRK